MMNRFIELEKAVLGTIIIEQKVYEQYSEMLCEEIFTTPEHIIIFSAIRELWEKNKPIDLITVNNDLLKKNQNHLLKYVVELSLIVSSSAHISSHIRELVEIAAKRDFISKFKFLLRKAEGDDDIFKLREFALEIFNNLFIEKFIDQNRKHNSFKELIQAVEDNFRAILEGKKTGIESSLTLINRAIGGWQNSDLNIVAGRPGMGKTAFMVQQIVDCATFNIPVGLFSLEMSAQQIAARILTNVTKIPNSSVLRKGLSESELSIYWSYKEELQNLQIFIDDTPGISISNLRLKAKMLKMRHNIGVLFVDYLQLVTNPEIKNNREQEISSISRGLKGIAKELDIPVVALSQLSRKIEDRADKRPMLSDLRESGAIEQDADVVMGIYRPEYYGIELWDTDEKGKSLPKDEKGHFLVKLSTLKQAEIQILKNRHGAIDFQRFDIDLKTSTFQNENPHIWNQTTDNEIEY